MKTKFKAIISAATAAAVIFSVGGIATAAMQSRHSEEEIAHMAAAELRDEAGWTEAFNEALLEGKRPTDPVIALRNGTGETGDEIMPAYLESASGKDTDVKLTLVHDNSDGGYILWSGRFIVDDVSSFAALFTQPESMNCVVGEGTVGELEYKNGYSVNFKKLMGNYTYLENDKRVVHYDTQEGVGQIPEVKYSYTGSGKLVEKALYFYMYRGDSTSGYYEVAVVHVVDKDYAQSAEYAALPYGGIIDSYTYVSPAEISGLAETV